MKATNTEAQSFKALHVPGKPLLLANVHDATSARLVASLPGCRALATASLSVALANGLDHDADLTLETQLEVVAAIAAVARAAGKPLTVDLQGGYGARLEEAVTAVIGLGAVGINLEDSDQKTGRLIPEDEAVDRIKRALRAASEAGLPDFVVNARSDANLMGEASLDEGIRRGRVYLDAGATAAFVLVEGMRGFTRDEVARAVRELDGRVNISLRLGPRLGVAADEGRKELTSADLAELGVARVSVGPQVFHAAAAATKKAASAVFGVAARTEG